MFQSAARSSFKRGVDSESDSTRVEAATADDKAKREELGEDSHLHIRVTIFYF